MLFAETDSWEVFFATLPALGTALCTLAVAVIGAWRSWKAETKAAEAVASSRAATVAASAAEVQAAAARKEAVKATVATAEVAERVVEATVAATRAEESGNRNANALTAIHKDLNGKLAALVEAKEGVARAAGAEQERQEERGRQAESSGGTATGGQG